MIEFAIVLYSEAVVFEINEISLDTETKGAVWLGVKYDCLIVEPWAKANNCVNAKPYQHKYDIMSLYLQLLNISY